MGFRYYLKTVGGNYIARSEYENIAYYMTSSVLDACFFDTFKKAKKVQDNYVEGHVHICMIDDLTLEKKEYSYIVENLVNDFEKVIRKHTQQIFSEEVSEEEVDEFVKEMMPYILCKLFKVEKYD